MHRLLLLAALVFGTAGASAQPAPSPNLVELGASVEGYATLSAAVQAAGLAETLAGEGPFTVFAPTDSAFAALPEGILDALLLPENQAQLADLLGYHVVPGRYAAADLMNGQRLTTLSGAELTVSLSSDGRVMVGNAHVVAVDAIASNGIAHGLDAVLLPPAPPDNGLQP